MLKKGWLIITLGYSITLAVVSLIKLNNLPNVGVSFGDKIFHFLAYGVLTFLWFNTYLKVFKFQKNKAIVYAAIISIIFGIIIEVLQGTVTVSRAFDVFDAIANTLGVLLAVLIIKINSALHVKKL